MITDEEYAPLIWLRDVLEESDKKALARLEEYLGKKLGYGDPKGVNMIIDRYPHRDGGYSISVRYKAYWDLREDKPPRDVGSRETLQVSSSMFGALNAHGIVRTKKGNVIIKKRFRTA